MDTINHGKDLLECSERVIELQKAIPVRYISKHRVREDMLDLKTANAIITIYNDITATHQAHFLSLEPVEMIFFTWYLIE